MQVLMIEDNTDHASLVAESIANEHTVETVKFLKKALAHPRLHEFDVILCDMSLPDSDGVENVRQLRSVAPDLPIVVLTCLSSEEAAVEVLEAGAQDYLVKSGTLIHPGVTKAILDKAMRYAVHRQRCASQCAES